jgi:hypothetical protein
MRRALLLVLSACGAPAAPPPAPTAAAVEHHDAAVDPPPPGRPSAPAPQARAPRPATASDADGLRPLDDAEAEELKKGCKKFLGALEAAGRTRSPAGRVAATEVMLDLLADPPRVDGVDLPRCTELVRRDLEIYRARTMESEAIQALRMIAIALQRADSPEAMCAAAPAVPADVARIEKGAYTTTAADWQAGGWRCIGFGSAGMPLRWQLETRAAGAGAFEIVARGFPVRGGAATELFLQGKLGETEPGEVMRR